jgi:signal peptidase II
MKEWGTKLVLLALVVTTIGCDKVSKHVASTHLIDGAQRSYIGDSLRLEYSENVGAFLISAPDCRGGHVALFSWHRNHS